MEAQLENIIAVQKEAWNKSSAGWKKWDNMMMNFLKPMNTQIIQMMKIQSDDTILDVATGTGEPGLTIATIVDKGRVVGTDLSEQMLSVAKEKAHHFHISNFETVCCDVSALPFDNDSFNSISCRLGFMFFPDIQIALKEMLRVLKPGGGISISVWSVREKNSWINVSMEIMISSLELAPPVSGAPGAFRCSETGFMTDHLRQAGIKNIVEKHLEGKLKFGNKETYWNFITEAGSPMAFGKADEALKQKIKNEVLTKVDLKCPGENIELDSSSIIIYGEK